MQIGQAFCCEAAVKAKHYAEKAVQLRAANNRKKAALQEANAAQRALDVAQQEFIEAERAVLIGAAGNDVGHLLNADFYCEPIR